MEPCSIKTQTGGCGPCSLWERLDRLHTRAQELILNDLGWAPFHTLTEFNFVRKSLFQVKLGTGVSWFAKRAKYKGRHLVDLKLDYLARHPVWSQLPIESRRRLCTLSKKEMQRAVDVWAAIEDCLFMATPEAFVGSRTDPVVNRFWRWTWTNVLQHGGVLHTVRLFKSMTVGWKHTAIQSVTPHPDIIRGSLFFDSAGLPCTSNFKGKWAWLNQVLTRGIYAKSLGTRFMHLVSTRGLPSPDVPEMQEGLLEHADIICSSATPLPEHRLNLYKKIALRLGRYVKSRRPTNWKSVAHLSLSDSASFDSGRKAGGRAAGLGKKYSAWANEIMVENQSKTGYLGYPYEVRAGLKRFQTMARPESDFLQPDSALIESDNQFDIDLDDLGNYVYEDRIYGLDQYTGLQIFQFSLEEGLKSGCLTGSPYYTGERLVVKDAPQVRMVPLGEPGGKVRVVTVAEDWLTEFLSPFGHEMIAALSLIESARAGLGASAQAYEWAKRLGRRKGIDQCEEELFLLTSDLKQASEFLVHQNTRALLKSFVAGAGLTCPYFTTCIDLLCSPRYISGAEGPFFYPYTGLTSKRGCLMGDPGTKAALTLTMLVAEEMALLTYHASKVGKTVEDCLSEPEPSYTWRTYSAAGDDHVAIGPRSYCAGIDDALEELGACLSREKCFLSKIGAFFTEELLLRTDQTQMELKVPLWEAEYDRTIHVDSVKVRLLSPCSKVTLVRDDKNPALGKCRQFLKKLEWLPSSFALFKDLAMSRFKLRFSSYLPWDNPMLYFPNHLGGLGIPPPDDGGKWMKEAVLNLPPPLLTAVAQVIEGKASEHVKRALWLFSSNTTYRGITMRTAAEEQIKFVFREFVADVVSDVDLLRPSSLSEEEWADLPYRRKARAVHAIGYVSLSEAVQMMERPTYFKQVLAGLGDLMKSDPLYLAYMDSLASMDELALSYECSFNELPPSVKAIVDAHRKNEQTWFARQAYLETWAFTLCEGADKSRQDVLVPLPEVEEASDTRSFSSTPFVARMDYMCRIIRRHISSVDHEDSVRIIHDEISKRGVDFASLTTRPADTWIPTRRMVNLCTLATPLEAAWSLQSGLTRPQTQKPSPG